LATIVTTQRDDRRHLYDPGEHPELCRTRDLADYDPQQLRTLLGVVKQQNEQLPNDSEIRGFLGRLADRDIEEFADELKLRLRRETTVLDSLDEEGLDPLAPDLREVKLPYPVRYVSSQELREMNPFHREVGAFYRGGTIFVGPNLPDLRTRLATLATRGILSNDLFHEVYHGHQDGDVHYASLDDVLHALIYPNAVEWKLALAESHAWLSCLRGFKDEVLIPVIRTSYEIENVGYLERAFKAINELNTLGVSDKQVGKLIGQTHWDDETGEYVALEREARRLAQEKGHTDGSLAEQVRKRKLIERIQALRAMGIVAELCAN